MIRLKCQLLRFCPRNFKIMVRLNLSSPEIVFDGEEYLQIAWGLFVDDSFFIFHVTIYVHIYLFF